MTAVLTMLAKERGGLTLKAQVLFWPATDASVDSQSYHDYATGRFLSRDFMKFGWDIYVSERRTAERPACLSPAGQCGTVVRSTAGTRSDGRE